MEPNQRLSASPETKQGAHSDALCLYTVVLIADPYSANIG